MPLKTEWVTWEHVYDTVLLGRMQDENRGKGGYKLENLLAALCKADAWKNKTEKISPHSEDWGPELRIERCRTDAWATVKLAEKLTSMLTVPHDYVRFTHRIAGTLDRTRLAGAMVDMTAFSGMRAGLQEDMKNSLVPLLEAAAAEGMTEFAPTNDNHIRELLYERLHLEPIRFTRKSKQPSVDKVSLKALDHEVAKLLLAYNKAEKLESVNGIGLYNLISLAGQLNDQPVGYLSFNINPLGARTGRRASSAPNSQNWPKSVRSVIRSRWTDGLIGDHDHKRLEVILIAWLAGDEKLLEFFTRRENGYIEVAKELWGHAVEEGTREYTATKSVILGVHYNMYPKYMAKQLWDVVGVRFSEDYEQHERETKKIWKKYRNQHAPVVAYMEAREAELKRTGQVKALTGAVRRLPLLRDESREGKKRFKKALNQAINFPVQHLAASITGSGLIDVEAELLREHGLSYTEYYTLLLEERKRHKNAEPSRPVISELPCSVIINEVHDDIVVDYHPDTIRKDTEIVIESMKSIKSLKQLIGNVDIPLDVTATITPRWGMKV
jgi:DNA polymerase I-like protein with 3'-5' exonuclease and polymerase domains